MGERGGATRIVAWKCPTCDAVHETRREAVACCNDRLWEQRAKERKAEQRRSLVQLKAQFRVRVERVKERTYSMVHGDGTEVTEYARGKCPCCGEWIKVPTRAKGTRGKERERRRKQARTLVLAQFGRNHGMNRCHRRRQGRKARKGRSA